MTRSHRSCAALALLMLMAGLVAVAPAAGSPRAIVRARQMLRGHMFTRFTETGTLGGTFDQRLHLCSSGRFIYDTVSYLPEAGTTTTTRVTGRWRVISARFSQVGLSASALVRGAPDRGGQTVTVRFARDRRGVITVDGSLVEVQRSDLCS